MSIASVVSVVSSRQVFNGLHRDGEIWDIIGAVLVGSGRHDDQKEMI